ncbi:MAG: methylmalonyl-CoA mutase family protein [Candidatus Krumholzibacteriia bacterium]
MPTDFGPDRTQHPALPPGRRKICRVVDPWGGSYYSSLTHELMHKAGPHPVEVERWAAWPGPSPPAVYSKLRIEEAAASARPSSTGGQETIVVNKYRLAEEDPGTLEGQRRCVRQVARPARLKAESAIRRGRGRRARP